MDTQAVVGQVTEGLHAANSRPFQRLLVGVDNSDLSLTAVKFAARLAEQLHADVLLLSVYFASSMWAPEAGFSDSDLRTERETRANQLLAGYREKLSCIRSVTPLVREGDPATEIVKVANEFEVDLIVLGAHARGAIAQAILGSVTRTVIQHARYPVVAVPHDADRDI